MPRLTRLTRDTPMTVAVRRRTRTTSNTPGEVRLLTHQPTPGAAPLFYVTAPWMDAAEARWLAGELLTATEKGAV